MLLLQKTHSRISKWQELPTPAWWVGEEEPRDTGPPNSIGLGNSPLTKIKWWQCASRNNSVCEEGPGGGTLVMLSPTGLRSTLLISSHTSFAALSTHTPLFPLWVSHSSQKYEAAYL